MSTQDQAILKTDGGESVDLKSIQLTGELKGLLFEATLEQHFSNTTDSAVEIFYTFPLPWGAVLLGLEVLLGDKRLRGAVIERNQAKTEYQEAFDDGHAAIMLEQNSDHSYNLQLGNVAAGEDCRITLRYAQTMQSEQQCLRLMIPTVIAPRYGNPLAAGLLPHQVVGHNPAAHHPFTLQLQLHGALAHARISSPSHAIALAQQSAAEHHILTLTLTESAWLDRDFILVLDQLEPSAMAIAANDGVTNQGTVVMANFYPLIASEATSPLATKILVDCSGSMEGSSLKAAQRALRQIVQQFDSEDRFALSRFGSTVEHPHADLMPATQVCRAQAQSWIDALQADMGGTEMEEALLSTFELDTTRSSDVLLITDGEIYQVEETIQSARLSGHRIFAVGIGSSPAYAYLRRLADATGGACEFVAPGEAVQAAMMRMFARMRSPRLTQLQLQWPQGPQPQWVTPLPLAAFSGDTITAYAHFDQPPQGAVQLMGQLSESRPLQAIGRIDIPIAVSTETTLPRMACAARIMATSRPHSMIQAEEVKALTELALTYQLVTAQTHFLLVHERAEADKNTAAPAQRMIDHMLPAGWAGELSVKTTRRSSSRYFESRVIDYEPKCVLEWNQSTDAFNPLSRFVGLNPLGMCRWAQSRPATDWPNDLATLQNIGLGEWLVDWLSDTGTNPAWAHTTEAQRAHVFLSIMAWPDVLQALENNQSLPQALDLCQKALLSQIQMASPPEVVRQQEDLIRDLCARMLTMSATAWPQEVFH